MTECDEIAYGMLKEEPNLKFSSFDEARHFVERQMPEQVEYVQIIANIAERLYLESNK